MKNLSLIYLFLLFIFKTLYLWLKSKSNTTIACSIACKSFIYTCFDFVLFYHILLMKH